ncbi:hypothetical protein SELMODRAFT_82841 [Selaginella moellendorffii]|uniref:Peroxisomal adenine nucleotide carrier 1 n=1 Tax=Selaginella moellendorffii TaxID=88036 RepID=D8R0W5_SELML|nr:peroxisomal adenine nucleotide carrier 1 [Selaginella moellendorffii]XP_002977039.1 peroxisomal adenine nucleotide carrier 1 [Selaginella moellendorffii]XP_024525410.1 peroxisomal adenine nucleotide carrier 1 [Selaginella moellendorffii]XP_024537966.1 peroxisomal adenine nucleotide carrier 1 [Selaginella moellendorffii]EFJ21648.1 hypothetical protein SELMODRAFT_106466 [Selaginella moellendorffii]EFJ33800.1 hypothetical protein SELMODRAFT_82841 [Selaginella moellendorffii]|eukprot:XP_002964962.1 peroxisomal adenine nucleotide carrier 1 [Selaginella moellendorffii]
MALDFKALTEATSGAVGGLLSTTILYPLDTCKTKYQAEVREGDSRKYGSLLDVMREAIASNRILSLYQGLGTKNLQSVISQFIYFYAYSYFKQLYLRRSKAKYLGTTANLLVAAAAGTCTAIAIQPLDSASAKMQTSTFGKSKSLWKTLTGGNWKDAFDGLSASLVLVSNPAIQYTVFEQLKGLLVKRHRKSRAENSDSSPLVISAFSAFLLGALSKTAATIITYPAIRCKIMVQAAENDTDAVKALLNGGEAPEKPPRGMAQACRLIWKREGALGFYKGLHAQIMKTVLAAALMLMIKEKVSYGTWAAMMLLQNRWAVQKQKIKTLATTS